MFTLLKRHDWILNGAILFLAVASLTMLSSISADFFWPQLIWFGIAFLILILFLAVDWRPFTNSRWLIYGLYAASIALLLATLIFAPTIRSSKSWLVFGPFRMQTAEVAKFALIVVLSAFLAKGHRGIAHFKNILIPVIYFSIPAALVLFQPDLGSTLIIFGVLLGFLLVSGLPWRYIFAGLFILVILAFLSWNYFLRDYQRERIVALFNPSIDPLGVNYSVIQSKIAIGSAGFFGKGYGQGTQVQLGFLPEAHSDFIFAALVEEWGLLGGLLTISAFLVIIFRLIRIGVFSENNFSKLLCLGTVLMFLWQVVLNVGSNVGLLPVVGVSFPFLSYGGSNLLVSMMLVGIIQSIHARK